MRARCKMPLELYDPALRGQYATDQVLEGEAAAAALKLYPDYFEALPETKPEMKKEK